MREVRINYGRWHYDDSTPLGSPGGFGAVFKGTDEKGNVVAIKRLHMEARDAAHREMKMAKKLANRELQHVLPFLDYGLDANSDSYFVVMPCAEKDLQQALDSHGAFQEEITLTMLLEIADGLLEVRDLVHRDLKPSNVVYHDGTWKIADFGIAKFVEDTTSVNTLRGCLSPPYAAPEQWNSLRPSQATDVYALGCIAYALLCGSPPFAGPEISDFRQQHLHDTPPSLSGVSSRLRSLLAIMLRKQPESRPDLQRVRGQLLICQQTANSAGSERETSVLAKAGAQDAERKLAEEARAQQVAAQINTRQALAD